jgi:outer membrane receptor protein involved in Fe transport
MPGMKWFLAAALCAALGVPASAAEGQGERGSEIHADSEGSVPAASDESQVTSQVASFAVTRLKSSPAVVTAIGAEEIREAGARDLLDVLFLVPGFFVGLDVQGVVGPGFRGLWGHEGKILLLVDGKEMNELMYSTMQLGNEFPVELIERVEVVRGPGSVIYGGNAELAVINVITRGLQGATDLMVSGSYGQMPGGASLKGGYSRRGFSASGRYVVDEVPGLSAFASGSLGQGQRSVGLLQAAQTRSMQGASALDPAVVQIGIGFRDVQASFLYHHLATTTLLGEGEALTAAPTLSTFDAYHAEVVGTWRPTDRIEVTPRFNFSHQVPWHTSDPESAAYYKKTASRTRGRLIGRWAPVDGLQLTVGGDAMFDHGHSPKPWDLGFQTPFNTPSGPSETVDYRTYAAFIELFSQNPIVTVAAGARYDHNSAVGGAAVPRLVLLREIGPVQLKGLFSLAFRWPGFENINAGADSGVPLKPESTRVFEFEAGWDLTRRQRLSANAFDTSIRDPIAFVIDGEDQFYRNLGRIGTRGVEAAYRIRGDWGHAEASYSFYKPSDMLNADNYQVPGRKDAFLAAPAHRLTVSGTVRPLPWLSLGPSLILLGPRYGLAPTTTRDAAGNEVQGEDLLEVGWQALANFAVRLQGVPAKGMELSLGVYNLFGVQYRFLVPYTGGNTPIPGFDREVLLRMSYLFEPGAN